MVCIYCSAKTKVINSRAQHKINATWRRRMCLSCNDVFTSIETPDLAKIVVVVTETDIQPFSRDKLLLSINSSLQHRKTALEDAINLTNTVISKMYAKFKNVQIQRIDIAKVVYETLHRFDKAAATHYKAFHNL